MSAVLAMPSYPERLEQFLAAHDIGGSRRDVRAIFDAVRNMPYASTGERTPQALLDSGKGACTAKHLLLRDLLRHIGEEAEVVLVPGDFAAGIPLVPGMSPELQHEIRVHGVKDFHCYAVWHDGAQAVKLDATWGDAMAAMNFPVNRDWDGAQDTRLALTPSGAPIRAEDVIKRKEELLATLAPADRERRRRFLDLLTAWMPA